MLTDAIWWEVETQKAQLIGLRKEADVYFNFDLLNLAGSQDRTSKPKAKTKTNAEFEKAQKRLMFTLILICLTSLGDQYRTLKPKAKTKANAEFENMVYKCHKRPSFTGWITLPFLKWIVPI